MTRNLYAEGLERAAARALERGTVNRTSWW